MSPRFARMWDDLSGLGRDPDTGGYRRFAWSAEDAALREWFAGEAATRGLDLVTDRCGNQWAWWGDPDADGPGVVLGSHLDSVPDGGAFDGPLGVVSAFAAVDALRARGFVPARPIAVAHFADEEGARFGVACAGSRLLTGVLDPDRARGLTGVDGVSMAEAMTRAGHDPGAVGRDDETLRRVGVYVELHVEQGRGLVDLGRPVAVGSAIWPHGRWRITLRGRADHAGTTLLDDRDDPMLALAAVVQEARAAARRHGAHATCGKVEVAPNAVNAIPAQVTAWLDARGADEERVRAVVADVAAAAGAEVAATGADVAGSRQRVPAAELAATGAEASWVTGGRSGRASVVEESWTGATVLDPALARRLAGLLDDAPVLATGAGHDAGILAAAGVPSAMLFVRNPTGISHSPVEHAEEPDCEEGVNALTTVAEDLAT